GACPDAPKPRSAPRSDNGACSQPDQSNGSGACVGTNAVVCTALDQCHDAGTCDTGTGLCSDPAKDDGTPCDDSDESTLNDACTSGVCEGNPVEPLPLRADFTT